MKNALLAVVLLIAVFTGNAQTQTEIKDDMPQQNEVKLNALFMVVGAFNFTYERLITEESGVGLEVFVPFDNSIDVNYYISPYYRLYFGKKYASGFFLEGFGMLNSENVYSYTEYNSFGSILREERKDDTNFALGIGLGGKWIAKSGFIGELNLGIGRNLIDTDYNNEIVGKIGITVGYRF
ncbi:MAG: DUF3575 domain-containing protein [Winogradskyella sp.]